MGTSLGEEVLVNGDEQPPTKKRSFSFPSAVTTLAGVTILVWLVALVIPPGQYAEDADGSPIPGTYQQIPSPLDWSERIQQLLLSPINGLYGLLNADSGFVSTEVVGRMFGQIGVIAFIMAIGAFISVSFATRSLEVAVAALAQRLRSKGWLLISAVMLLFSVLGSTMGFSVETFGFYALFIPLLAALGYDRMTTAAMIILGALTGVAGSTVNPFSIGVAAGEAGEPLGEGIALRLLIWVVLTAMSIGWVLRYAARVRRDPSRSLVGWNDPDADEASDTDLMAEDLQSEPATADHTLTGTQKWVLVVTGFAFALMIFSVIPWSSILGATSGPADYYATHDTAAEPYWWELNWWFPQLAMLFLIASVVVGLIARMKEGEIVKLIGAGAADMIGPAMVVSLAGGVSAIMTNTKTLDTILNSMEQAVSGVSAGGFAVMISIINMPLALLVPSTSGHAALAMPLLAPLADFAGVSRITTISAWMSGTGITMLWAPTQVVVVGGLAIAKVGYDAYLRFVWPLLVAMFVVTSLILAAAAGLG